MKIKIVLAVLFSIVILNMSSAVLAQSMTDAQKQSLISQIQQQILALQQQLSQMLAQQQGVTSQQQGSTSWCHTFNNNLGFADSGSKEVSYLHTVLQKEGITYSPDGDSVYSTGTVSGVKQFQIKYNISSQTGYLGAATRVKINQLYACAAGVVSPTNCIPSWQSDSWGTCTAGQQTRVVSDSNNCGVTANQPATTQSCSVKAIDIQVGSSDGPINNFLTLGSGATVNSTGIFLSENVNLQWIGVGVSSCVASDSLSPTLFSGYEPSSGSQSVTLSGNIQGTSSSSKISDTFKISCISTTTGSQVSDSITVNLFYTANSNCAPSWQCAAWSTCLNKQQTRTCTDYNGCGSLVGKPVATQSCANCVPSWQAGTWSTCANSQQTRTVTDTNSCGTTTGKPTTSQSCCSATCLTQSDGVYAIGCSGNVTKCPTGRTCQQTYSTTYVYSNGVAQTVQTLNGSQCICVPSWQTGDWSPTCVNGMQTRTVTDSNNCGVTTNKPATSQACDQT